MAETNLANMIVPEVFGNYVANLSLKTNRFVQSGILTPDPTLGARLTEPGTAITVPFINDLPDEDPDVWTDTTDIQVSNLTSGKQMAQKFYQAKSFGLTDQSALISGAPIQNIIGSRFANYWIRQDAKLLLNVLTGVFGVSKIQDSKIYDATAKMPTEANFNAKGFIGAKALMGDLSENTLTAIAVNSATYAQMQANGLIDTIQEQNAATPFGTYNSMTIVVDDDIPVDLSDKSKPTTTSYIFGTGAIGYSQNLYSTATERHELINGGETDIVQKRIATIHVIGTSIKNPIQNASYKDFAKSANWEVVDGIDPRTVRVVAYKSTLDPTLVPGAEVPKPTPITQGQGETEKKN